MIYELLGLKGEVSQKEKRLVEFYSAALTVYQTYHWSQAIEFFQRVMGLYPKDLPTQLMIKRCKNYQQNPPLEDWDGIWRMPSK